MFKEISYESSPIREYFREVLITTKKFAWLKAPQYLNIRGIAMFIEVKLL